MIPFVPRLPELLALEGVYDGIILSCRHKDILRCSTTRHFSSCFGKGGFNELMPTLYCYRPEICIIGIKDCSGAWQARIFGFYTHWFYGGPKVLLSKIYGNGLSIEDVKYKLRHCSFVETYEDLYFPLP